LSWKGGEERNDIVPVTKPGFSTKMLKKRKSVINKRSRKKRGM